MDKKKWNRNLIDLAVSQGIREIRQNPQRGIRRLNDMAERVASKWYKNSVFIRIHKILQKKDSQYYRLVENLLEHVEESTIKEFSMNLGYNSWIYGADKLRKQYKINGESAYWLESFAFDGEKEDAEEQLNKISEIIKKKRQAGVYTYALYPQQSFEKYPQLIFLLRRFSDCSFLWFFKEDNLKEAQVNVLKKHKNCIFLFPAVKTDGTANLEIAEIMKQNKMLYSYYQIYTETENRIISSDEILSEVLKQEPPVLIMVADDTVSEEKRMQKTKEIWEYRNCPAHPTFMIEFTQDCKTVNDMILAAQVQNESE